ncbi:hypothetical protein RCL1_005832 [Eukaryota sp. TZLM3-RCL]
MSLLERVDRYAVKQIFRDELQRIIGQDPEEIVNYFINLLDRARTLDDAKSSFVKAVEDMQLGDAETISSKFIDQINKLTEPEQAPSRPTSFFSRDTREHEREREPREHHHSRREQRRDDSGYDNRHRRSGDRERDYDRRKRRRSVSPEPHRPSYDPSKVFVSDCPTHVFKISVLARSFEEFGDLVNVILKKNTAILQFASEMYAKSAFDYVSITFKGNHIPVTVTYMGESRTTQPVSTEHRPAPVYSRPVYKKPVPPKVRQPKKTTAIHAREQLMKLLANCEVKRQDLEKKDLPMSEKINLLKMLVEEMRSYRAKLEALSSVQDDAEVVDESKEEEAGEIEDVPQDGQEEDQQNEVVQSEGEEIGVHLSEEPGETLDLED